MFGYIRTHRPELKIREDETYKGIYCSLCNELGKRYGILSRLFLSYDSTFLALALMALSEEELFQKGLDGRAFVLETRNNMIQAGKILDMLNH